ncbi:MAG: gliding motility-associated C-terminal domain-containing protein [Saprospiraceae bacterium]|uniref:Gliding motility-associated C-terminal domain-containing protein n=1 Tax=Candidatus Defluviibacterium haderslevense TaxID=2981993 RepID=A0A9D7S8G3_9BACT|nr:gliding motility-associated C-terminal domain-containing protein [Candidatus Defluviibacterium haderslevense]
MTIKIYFTVLSFLYFSSIAVGQENLVLNGSFEKIDSCPLNGSEIYLANPWTTATIEGTPDLYHTCGKSIGTSVPKHTRYSYQWPKTGDAYSGLNVYYSGNNPNNEMLKGSLKTILKSKIYYIEFYISPKVEDDPEDIPCYVEGIGLSLSKIDSIFHPFTGEPIPIQPTIYNNGIIIKDSANWTRVSGCTKGNGEKNIYIGNFKSNKNTLVDPLCHTSYPNSAYYYIDDIGVYEFNPLPDTIYLCKGESKQIGSKFLDGTYLWNSGERDSVITIDGTGKYIVNVQMENCILSDTVIVLDPEAILADQDNTFMLCKDEKIKLEVPINGIFQWSTGEQSKTIYVSKSGEYTFEVINECGIFSKTFTIAIQECDCHLYTPNIFSPNGDNLNDKFELISNCNLPIKILSFEIYNRWGELMYRVHDFDPNMIHWDGKVKGNEVPPGVYVWNVVYEYHIDSNVLQKNQSGDVTLFR